MRKWAKEWGQFLGMLVAVAALYGFIRSDMAALEARIGQRFDRIDQRFSGIDQRFDGFEKRFDDRLRGMEERIAGVERRLGERIDRLETKVDRNGEAIAALEGYVRGRLGDPPSGRGGGDEPETNGDVSGA